MTDLVPLHAVAAVGRLSPDLTQLAGDAVPVLLARSSDATAFWGTAVRVAGLTVLTVRLAWLRLRLEAVPDGQRNGV